jgi:hypothetical protein
MDRQTEELLESVETCSADATGVGRRDVGGKAEAGRELCPAVRVASGAHGDTGCYET